MLSAESHLWVGFFKEKRKLRAQSSCSAHWNIKSFKDSECELVISRFSRARLLVILRTVARQAPLSVGFSRENAISHLCVAPKLTTFHKYSSVQFSPVTQSCPTLCDSSQIQAGANQGLKHTDPSTQNKQILHASPGDFILSFI